MAAASKRLGKPFRVPSERADRERQRALCQVICCLSWRIHGEIVGEKVRLRNSISTRRKKAKKRPARHKSENKAFLPLAFSERRNRRLLPPSISKCEAFANISATFHTLFYARHSAHTHTRRTSYLSFDVDINSEDMKTNI